MMLSLFILIPLLAGLGLFAIRQEAIVRNVALLASIATLGVVLYALSLPDGSASLSYSTVWLGALNSNFSLALDGAG